MSSEPIGPGTALPPLPLPPAGRPVAPPPKNPWIATLLSVFPGLGQVYNGQPAKALVFFFAWVGSIWGAIAHDPMPFALLIPFVYLYNLVDAFRTATMINARAAGGAPLPEEDVAESPAWGAALVGLGLLLLLNNLGWLDLIALRRFWPVVLIVAGVMLLWRSTQQRGRAQADDGPRP
jgi:TM2 domain-containing membrane protein YozV